MATPKKYRVGKSKIQGQGAFAKKDLNVGEYIGKVHTINKLYTDYDFTELGKKHNHSEDPNVQNILIGNERHLFATRPIEKGEELTSNYRLQPDLEQPDGFNKAEDGESLTKEKALEILSDGRVYGKRLTRKQKKFFGAVAGGAEPYKAQNGIEGTMGGLTDKGFNFNPAWGGAWENGGWLDKYSDDVPQAQNGDILEYLKKGKAAPVVTKGKPLSEKMQKRITSETLKRQTQKSEPLTETNTREQAVERGRAENLRVVEENKEYDRQALAEGKAAEATRENPNIPFTFPTGETKLWKDMDWRERQYVSGKNLGSSLRFNNWTDYINPLAMIGDLGEGLSSAPYLARETESNLPYVLGAAGLPLLTGPLSRKGVPKLGKYIKKLSPMEDGGNLQPPMSGAPQPAIPMAQFGLTYLEPNSYKLPRVGSSSELAMSVGGENGEPAYLIPSMKYGRMQVDPMFEFKRTGEHLGGPFKTWQEAEAWERDVRHPYVEKGQSIPTPYRRWGQFAMGGSIPGSVGFTYARVAGAAPSEGPRAKKTIPSAQNGMEMKYYQEGLDWKPKTISKNGGWLDKYDDETPKAQNGRSLSEEQQLARLRRDHERYMYGYGDLPQQSGVKTAEQISRDADMRKAATAAAKKKEERDRVKRSIENQGTIDKPAPRQGKLSRAWEIATHPVQYFGYAARNQEAPQYFSRGDIDNLDLITSTINPLTIVDAAANVPRFTIDAGKSLFQGNLSGAGANLGLAAANVLGALPLAGAAINAGSIAKTFQKGFKNAWDYTSNLPKTQRLRNALNVGAVALKHADDVPGHSYFGMSPDVVKQRMAEEITNLPKGAYTMDPNMSKNSAPLFWNKAAQLSNQGFTIVRPGTMQSLNNAGTLGRRVAGAVPQEAAKLYPDIIQAHEDRIKYLLSQGMTSEAARVQKQGFMPQIVGSLSYANPGTEAEKLYLQFLQSYKPTLDEGIIRTNQATGLGFPMTEIVQGSNQLYYAMPTAIAVKGNPLQRVTKALLAPWKDYYLGPMKVPDQMGGFNNVRRASLYRGDSRFMGFDLGNPLIQSSLEIPSGLLPPLLRIQEDEFNRQGIRRDREGGVVKDDDYEFDGTSVREYPVAQKGKAVQTSSRSTGPMKLSPSMPTASDSLALYNNALQVLNYYNSRNYKNRGSRQLTPSEKSTVFNEVLDKDFADVYELSKLGGLSEVPTTSGKTKKITGNELVSNYRKNVDKNKFHQRESLWSILDTRSPMQLYDRRISPTTVYEYMNMQGNDPLFSDWVNIHGYDPLAVKPYNMRTAKEKTEWDKKYGNKTKTQQKPKPKPVPPVKKETPKPLPKKEQSPSPERKVEKPQPKQEVVKKPEPVIEKKAPLTDYSQGIPVYAPTPYSPGAGAFVGYRTPQGDTVFVKPEDYERMGVPKYGREFIESKQKKQRNGGVSVNRADEYPLRKLDDLLNFTNYNKPKAKKK